MHEFRSALIEWLQADATLVSRTGHTDDDTRIFVDDPRFKNVTPSLALIESATHRPVQGVDEFYITLAALQTITSPSDDSYGDACDKIMQRVVELAERGNTGDARYSNDNVILQSIVVDDPPDGSMYEEERDKWISGLTLRIAWKRA